MKKLGLKPKLEDKEEVKGEKISEQVEEDRKPKLFSANLKGKYSLFEDKEEKPEQYLAPAEDSHEEKTVDRKEIVVPKEDIQTQQRSPITFLSDDEGYLLEDEQLISKAELKVEIGKEIPTSGSKATKSSRKKNKLEVVELAAIHHQGKELKMLGEATSYCRPKTRSKNKLRLNMKRLLNPRLNSNEVTVIDDVSPDEKPEVKNISRKEKKPIAVKASYVHPAKTKSSLTSLEDSS